MVQQQTCPGCATANSTFASSCRVCSATLTPSPAAPAGLATSGPTAPVIFDRPAAAARPAPLEGIALAPLTQPPPNGAPSVDPSGHKPAALVFDSHGSAPPVPVDATGWFGGATPAAAFVSVPVATAASSGALDPTEGLGFLASPAPATPAPPALPPETAEGAVDGDAWPKPAAAAPTGFHLNQWGTTPAGGPPIPATPTTPVPASPAYGGSGLGQPSPAAEAAGERGWGIREQTGSTPHLWSVGPGAVTPFGTTAAHVQPVPPGFMPAPWPEPQPAPVTRRSYSWVALLLILIVGVAGVFVYLRYYKGSASTPHTVSLPAAIGGVPQNTDAGLASTASAMQSQAGQPGGITHSVAGFYGDQGGGVPKFAILAVAANRALTTTDSDGFVRSLNTGSPDTFNAGTATTQSDSGVDYTCGPVTESGVTASLCYWRDGNVFGAVIGFPGVESSSTLAEAEAARVAVEH